MLMAEPSSSLASIREPATVDVMADLMQSSAPGSIGCTEEDHEPFVYARAEAECTRCESMESAGVLKDHVVCGGEDSVVPVLSVRPSKARSEGLSVSVSSCSGGQVDAGSKRAMEVVIHRILPATCGWMENGVSADGNSPGPKSAPSAMTARENVTVIAARPFSETAAEELEAAGVDGVSASTDRASSDIADTLVTAAMHTTTSIGIHTALGEIKLCTTMMCRVSDNQI